jgi:hypothetical protein
MLLNWIFPDGAKGKEGKDKTYFATKWRWRVLAES